MPRFEVTVRELSTYDLDAADESQAASVVRSAIRGERVLVPMEVVLERLEVRPVADPTPPPMPPDRGTGAARDPRDDPDDPLVRLPRIL